MLVPFGALEGLPAIRVQASDIQPNPKCLVALLAREMATGRYPEVVLVDPLDWDSTAVVAALTALATDLPALTLWHHRPYGVATWPSVVNWVVEDVSELLSGRIALADLTLALSERPPTSAPTEVIVRKPHPSTTHKHLDEVSIQIGPLQSWVYSDDPKIRAAVGRTHSTWGVRNGRPQEG